MLIALRPIRKGTREAAMDFRVEVLMESCRAILHEGPIGISSFHSA